MGLYIMAMADMTQDNHFLSGKRMEAQAANSQRPPEFLSTHPSPDNRRSD